MPDSEQKQPVQTSPTATLIIVSLVQFLVPYLISSVYVALPAIGRDLHASAAQLGLAVTVQVLAMGAVLLPVGRFADIVGRKKIFLIGTALLGVATLALGFAPTIESFLVIRFVQGIGSAMILANSIAILTAVFPPQKRGRAMGVIASMVYIGLSLGPTISGFIVGHLGWRWVFYTAFIAIVAALILSLLRLKGEWRSAAGEPFDWSGAAVFIIALCLLVYGASEITEIPWARWLALLGVLGVVLFGILQWRAKDPLLDVRMLVSNREFTFSNLATFLNYAALNCFTFLFSLYLQYIKGMPPQHAGLFLVIQPVVQACIAPVAGRLSDRYRPAFIATLGMAGCTAGLLLSLLIQPESTLSFLGMLLVLLGISLGFFGTPNMTAIMNAVEPRHFGTASALVSTMRTLGMICSSTAIAVILSIYMGNAAVTHSNTPIFMHAMKTCLYLFSAMSLLGTFFSLTKGKKGKAPLQTSQQAESKP